MSEFREKIQTLKDQFPVILSEYEKNYYTGTDQTKLNVYNTYNSNVAKCIRDMRDITVTLQAQNNGFVDVMSQLNKLIADEQRKNTELKDQIENMKNVNNGSATLVSDYKENYNETNMRNWAMVIGILAICISFLKFFIIPTSAEGMLMIKNKKLEDAGNLVKELQKFAIDLNDKRIYYIEGEKRKKTDLEKQRIYERVKAEEEAKYAVQSAREAAAAARDAAREAAKPK
jgi:hypothetical protein